MKPELKKMWQKSYDLGVKYAERFETEREALNAMPFSDLAYITHDSDGCSEFFHAGFVGREPEWVEAYRFGEIPSGCYSVNYIEHKYEPGISCVNIIRDEEAAKKDAMSTLYAMLGRDLIRVGGWWLGLNGSDGEPTLLGCVKIG